MQDSKLLRLSHGVSIFVFFLLANVPVLSGYTPASYNIWISYLLSLVPVAILYFTYVKLCNLYPKKNIFEIFNTIYGNIAGKIFSVLYILYALNLAVFNFRYNSEFVSVMALPNTPQIVLLLFFCIICFYIVYLGSKCLGRFCAYLLPITLVTILCFIVFSFNLHDYSHFEPIFVEDIPQILDSTFLTFSVPFGEFVICLAFFPEIEKKKKGYKLLSLTFIISAIVLVLIMLNDLLVLGAPTMSRLYFPTYIAISLIDVSFLSNVEVFSILVFLLAGIIKVSICVMVAYKGIEFIFFKNKEPKFKSVIIASLSFICCVVANFIFENTMQLFEIIGIYKYVCFLFAVFPSFTWIFGIIKKKKAV